MATNPLANALNQWMTPEQMLAAYTPDSGSAQNTPGNFQQPGAAQAFTDPAWLQSLGFTGNAVTPASGGYAQESGNGQAYDTQSPELTNWLQQQGYTEKQRFGPGNTMQWQYFDAQGNPVGMQKSASMSDPAFGAASLAAALVAGGAAAGAFGGTGEGAATAGGLGGADVGASGGGLLGAGGEAAGSTGYALDPALFGGAGAPLDLGSMPTFLTDGATFSTAIPEGVGYTLDPTLFGGGMSALSGATPPISPDTNPLDQHLAEGSVTSPGDPMPSYTNPLDQHLAEGSVTSPGMGTPGVPWQSLGDMLKGIAPSLAGALSGHPSGGGQFSMPSMASMLGGGSQVGPTPGMQPIASPMQMFPQYKNPYAIGLMGS